MASLTKIVLSALALMLSPATADAATTVISLEEAPAFGGRGAEGNTVILKDIGAFAHITSIAYSLSVEAASPGWLSDQQAWFGSSDIVEASFTPAFDRHEEGVAQVDGVIDLVAQNLDFLLNDDGQLRLELINRYSTFDQPSASWTGTFTVTSEDAATDGAVPEPATWVMMIVGFGIVGAALRGRHIASLDAAGHLRRLA